MRMQINGRAMAVDVVGEGPPMLLVHGLGGTGNHWTPVVSSFADRFRLVVPDLPGSGGSEGADSLSIGALAEALLALMDALGLEAFHLVGHSMGTVVCQHIAVSQPERVHDLVLLGPLAEPPEAARDALRSRAEAAEREGMDGIANTIADVALSKATKQANPVVVGFVRELLMRQDPRGYAASCRALAGASAAQLKQIRCRTLLITGDEDGVAPPDRVAELEKQLPNASCEILSDCGHWTLLERPERTIELMRTFYEG